MPKSAWEYATDRLFLLSIKDILLNPFTTCFAVKDHFIRIEAVFPLATVMKGQQEK